MTTVVLNEDNKWLSVYFTMLEHLKFRDEDCRKLVLFIMGKGKDSEPNSEIQ